jgi:hypothetical protein
MHTDEGGVERTIEQVIGGGFQVLNALAPN